MSPTVPNYPEEDWMSQLGLSNGSRKRFNDNNQRFAMMAPKRGIPESPTEESEKIITGAAAGPSAKPLKFKGPWTPGDPIPAKAKEKFEQPKPSDPSYDKWMEEHLSGYPASQKSSLSKMADRAVENIYKIADKFVDKWHQHIEGVGRDIKPIDWNTIQNKYAPGVDLPSRAVEQGYNPRMPIYKGGSRSELRRELPDPEQKGYERGQFFADQPRVAKDYGYTHEYVAAPKNPAVVDMGGKSYNSESMHRVIESARDKGHDLLVVKNLYDLGSRKPQNQVVVLDNSIVRSPKAEFDPSRMHIKDVLATILGAAAIGKTVKDLDPDKK